MSGIKGQKWAEEKKKGPIRKYNTSFDLNLSKKFCEYCQKHGWNWHQGLRIIVDRFLKKEK